MDKTEIKELKEEISKLKNEILELKSLILLQSLAPEVFEIGKILISNELYESNIKAN